MQTQAETRLTLKDLNYLPSLAGYILNNRLQEYVNLQLQLSRKLNIPLLSAFVHFTDQQILDLSLKTSTEFLSYIFQNKAEEQIENGIANWIANRLPFLDKNDIKAEDITLLTYIRKQSFLHFIPEYCSNTEQILDLIKEIDLYCLESETRSTNTYIKLLKDRIEENIHFIEKINNTTPSAIYVFDIDKTKGIYSNNKLGEILGYSQNELNTFRDNVIENLIHPDDRNVLKTRLQQISNLKGNETISYDYRIKHKNGNYRWVRSYESVFKRHSNGTVWQTIGIILDIDKEKKTADALIKSDERYKQAESLTHIGNYEWDLKTKELVWSEELYRIYGLEPQSGTINSAFIETFNHPDDKEIVKNIISKSIEQDGPFSFYYRIILHNGQEKILHARGEFVKDENNIPIRMIGTAQDVTEKEKLTNQLREKESIYKQAEELANMGNWTWDFKNQVLEWTDQLYKIYGLEPQSEPMNTEKILSFVHPEDKEYVANNINVFDKEKTRDFTFRIISKDGNVKTLRSIAKVQTDKNGNPYFVVGTERDITEKQTLIDKLQKSEDLYKQAQFLAHVGNWSWDIKGNTVSWSDELYRIYGLEPQSETITYERYISFVHPEDKERVLKQINHSAATNKPWKFMHRIISAKGDVRIIGATGEVLTNNSGEAYMMIGTAQDITERENLIEKLQESEKHFKQAQSMAHLGNWSIDLITNEYIWSDEMYNIYELDKTSGITRMQWENFIHPDEREEVLNYLNDCIKNNTVYDKVYRIVLDSGKIKTVHRKGEFIIDKEGRPVKMIGTTQDVTEEYRINQELKENQTFIKKITDATPSIIASYNIRTGKYVYISEGLEKLLGYSTKDVMEKG
ncbi:MAG: PAS domain-containing protein, partial [Flavisolibacter sp.]